MWSGVRGSITPLPDKKAKCVGVSQILNLLKNHWRILLVVFAVSGAAGVFSFVGCQKCADWIDGFKPAPLPAEVVVE